MSNQPPLRLIDPQAAPPAEGTLRLSIDLPLRGDVLRLTAEADDRPARLADAAAIVHAIDDRLMALYLRQAAEAAKTLHCREGCDVCCRRYLILACPAELDMLLERLAALDGELATRFESWQDRLADEAAESGLVAALQALGDGGDPREVGEAWWRAREDRDCPFLRGGACGVYHLRPVACREHYSDRPPEFCARYASGRLPLPLSLENVLWRLESTLTGRPSGAIPLPLVKFWRQGRAPLAHLTWPAGDVLGALADELRRTAAEAARLYASASARPED